MVGAAFTAAGPATAAETVQLTGVVSLDAIGGPPAAGIVVQAYIYSSDPLWIAEADYPDAAATTGSDGGFRFDGLAPADYMLVAVPTAGDDRAPGLIGSLSVRTDTDGAELVLAPGGTISGTVVSPDGQPVADATLWLQHPGTGGRFDQHIRSGPDGAFAFASLIAGDYSLVVHSSLRDPVTVPITLAASQAISDLTIKMLPLASISGRVSSSTDTTVGLAGIVVGYLGKTTTTAGDGTWSLTVGQLTGDSRLSFTSPTAEYLPQWWKGAATREDGKNVYLRPGEQAKGYDAQLIPAATLSGRVTAFGDGTGLPGVSVRIAVPNSGNGGTTVFTDSEGDYVAPGLAPGTYDVTFEAPGTTYLRAVTRNVVILRGKAVTADAVLDRSSGITGTVSFEGSDEVDLTKVRLRMTGQTVRPDAQGHFAFTGLAGGRYSFQVLPDDGTTYLSEWYRGASSIKDATLVPVEANKPPTQVEVVVHLQDYPKTSRVAGADRYSGAVAVSKKAFPDGAATVYIATGENYPDALSAGAAAVTQGGPLLMTPTNSLPADVEAEIERLNPARIVVVGGPKSVSPAVFSALKGLAPKTTRVDGQDRYAVSRTLARDVFGGSGADVVYVATGTNFPDALGASGAAGFQGGPVLLVDGRAGTLDAATATVLRELDPDRIVIAGGPASVSPGIASALSKYAPVDRFDGADRYETSVAINLDAYPSSAEAFLVTGSTYPDALSGSAWAGHLGAPLYVSPVDCVPQITLDALAEQGVKKLTLIGGPNSLSPEVLALKPCP